MKNNVRKVLFVAGLLSPLLSSAAVSVSPLSTFGGGDGWLSPGEGGYQYLGTGSLERGMAFGNNHVYLASRANIAGNSVNIRILDPGTGADLGGLSTGSGVVSGGTFAINMVSVAGDGAIYVGNLTTAASAGTPYKIYRWGSEVDAAPTVAFTGIPLAGARMGDDLDVTGSGAATRATTGFGNNPSIAGNNGYTIVDTTGGTSSAVAFAGTPPNAGDFRLGITFIDADTILGTQGGTGIPARLTDFAGTAGTLLGSPLLTAASERPMDYAVIGGLPLLATIDTAASTVRVYDMTDPLAPALLATANNTSGTLTANANGAGAVAWGTVSGDTATLFAMSSNQGIQAFNVVVPEPSTAVLFALGGGLLLWGFIRRRI